MIKKEEKVCKIEEKVVSLYVQDNGELERANREIQYGNPNRDEVLDRE